MTILIIPLVLCQYNIFMVGDSFELTKNSEPFMLFYAILVVYNGLIIKTSYPAT